MMILGTRCDAEETTATHIALYKHAFTGTALSAVASVLGVLLSILLFPAAPPEVELRDDFFFVGKHFIPLTKDIQPKHPTEVGLGKFSLQYLAASEYGAKKLPIYLSEYETSGEGCRKLQAIQVAFIGPKHEAWQAALHSEFRPALQRHQQYGRCAVTVAGFSYQLVPHLALYAAEMKASMWMFACIGALVYVTLHVLYLLLLLLYLSEMRHDAGRADALV